MRVGVTIKDISKRAEVSIATVSKVINGNYSKVSDETRIRILQIADELHYRPNMLARGLVSQKFNLIGLIIPDISNPYYAEMARGITDEALRFGYNAIINNTDAQHAREIHCIQTMAEYNVGGIVLTGNAQHVDENVALLQRYRVPYIGVENYKPGSLDYCVYVDNYTGSYKVVSLLLDYGHRHIAYITGYSTLEDPADERLRGYKQALTDRGVRVDPSLIKYGGYNLDTGYKQTQQLLSRGIPFTAIACGNDLIALGALKAIREFRLSVPGDISLVGFDDVFLSTTMEPRLTTVKQPAYEMGTYAIRMLVDRIEKHAFPESEKVKCFEPLLVSRDTVSAPHADVNAQMEAPSL